MPKEINWPQLLNQCSDNLLKQVSPMLKILTRQMPSLGVGAGGDPMRQIDLTAEHAITSTLEKHGLSFTLISEESGIKEYGNNPQQAFVTTDPIDGTTNLTRGIPFYATSIAVSTEPSLNTVHTALVTDLVHNRTYTAQKGNGAVRNNQRVEPSENTLLEEAVIGMDINTFEIRDLVPKMMIIVKRIKHIRHLGANALELCYVADGTTDAFIDIRGKLRTTDMAAASLIIREAEAKITTPEGKPIDVKLDPTQKVSFVAAGNQHFHKVILDLIEPEKEKQ